MDGVKLQFMHVIYADVHAYVTVEDYNCLIEATPKNKTWKEHDYNCL